MKYTKTEQEEARAALLEILKPGDTVYSILRHVSQSGMSRNIDFYVMQDCQPRCISRLAAVVTSSTLAKDRSIRMGGCGMDMGFALVYDLARTLWKDGFDCADPNGEYHRGCPSNDHSNRVDTTFHKDGGYALRNQWI